MLTNAFQYKESLITKFHQITCDPKYMYYFGDGDPSFQNENIGSPNLWPFIERASVGNFGKRFDEHLLGYMKAYITRSKNNTITSIAAVCFEPSGSFEFAKDLMAFYEELFILHKCSKINWDVCAISPHLNSYKKLCQKWGGRVFGPFKKDFKCWNGDIHDTYKFEITSEEFLQSIKTNEKNYKKLRRIK